MADNGTTINIAVGQVISIELPTDASVMRSWQNIKYNDSILVQKGKPNHLLTSDVESPGVYQIKFEAVNVGTSNISLEYSKKMGKDKTPDNTFEIEVKVHQLK